MTVTECYKMLKGDYSKIMGMLQTDALIKRLAVKYLNDPSYDDLKASLEKGETDAAFQAAHSLKGVSGNLAFTKLYGSACKITELLRSGDLAAAIAYFPVVEEDHELTCAALSQL